MNENEILGRGDEQLIHILYRRRIMKSGIKDESRKIRKVKSVRLDHTPVLSLKVCRRKKSLYG